MTKGNESPPTQRRTLDLVINVAILLTLAVVLFSPSGIVGHRFSAAIESWRTKRAIAEVWPELADVDSKLDGGGHPGRIVVEFVDYQCPLCRRIANDVSARSASEHVDVVVRHLPLDVYPNSRQAALAAVCSEEQQLFPQAHAALLTGEQWIAEPKWLEWAAMLGVEDLQAFESCLSSDAALRRIDDDVQLANRIGVTGTPTFLTKSGMFLGEPGLSAAIASLAPTTAPPDASPALARLSATPIFDSGEHTNTAVSQLGSLSRAMMLNDERIVLLDVTTLLFINPWTGEVWTAGGEGEGPGEFAGAGLALSLFRRQDDLAVWDPNNDRRLTVFSDTGEIVDTRRVALPSGSFRHWTANMMGIFADGSFAFIDRDPPVTGTPDGKQRSSGYVVLVSEEEKGRTIARFPDAQPGNVLLRHSTLVSFGGNRVSVADTDSDEVRILDRSGRTVSTIPMPGQRVRVSSAQLEAARVAAQGHHRRGQEITARELMGRSAERYRFREREYLHNEVAPPIDRTQFDGDVRLWIRDYVMPGDEAIRWTVWHREGHEFSLEMPSHYRLLDARGDLVLLGVRNTMGVDRVEIRRLVSG